MLKISIVIGTRPEAIKLAPLLLELISCDDIEERIILTGQHKEIVDSVMQLFSLKANNDLNLMLHGQSLTHITCSSLQGLRDDFLKFPPDLVIVQGDTTTAFSAALSAFYEKIPLGHVEAGLRTDNLYAPFPEEANRRLISQIANIHFAPTLQAKENLLASGIKENIYITGNTVIDSLLLIAEKTPPIIIDGIDLTKKKLILTTVHRRENWGNKLIEIINGIKKVLQVHEDAYFLLPVHPNQKIREPFNKLLGNHPRFIICEPLDYDSFVGAIKASTILLTDSGGLQEEAPSLGKPVLVLRDSTERPEGIAEGTSKLVGTNPSKIFSEIDLLLTDDNAYKQMAQARNPFGDGMASKRILDICRQYLRSDFE